MPVKWFPSFVSVLGDGTYYGTAADHQLTIENASKRHGRDLEHGAPAHPPKHGRRSWLFLNPVSGFFKFLFGSKGNDIELSAPNRATIQTTTPSSAAVPTETRVLQEIQHQGYTDNTDGATSLSTSRVRRAGDTRHSGFPDPAPGPSRTPSHSKFTSVPLAVFALFTSLPSSLDLTSNTHSAVFPAQTMPRDGAMVCLPSLRPLLLITPHDPTVFAVFIFSRGSCLCMQ